MGNDEEFFYKKWVQIHTLLGIEPDGDELESLLARWTGPGRFHHGPNHLRQGLIIIDLLGEGYDPKLIAIVGLAYFFHDAIYDIGAKDNEEQSAALFISYAVNAKLDKAMMDHGARLIIKTKNHWANRAIDDRAWAIMNDADLAILAANPKDYASYTEHVWMEYEAVYSRKDFLGGRIAFLEGVYNQKTFMTEPAFRLGSKFSRFCYRSNLLDKTSEQYAQENMTNELAELRFELLKLELAELRAQ